MSRNYDDWEKVMHKLLGAAYQMTFTGHHEMAARTATMAVSHYEQTHQDDRRDTERGDSRDAPASCPFCRYEGPSLNSVEQHISGSTDRVHEGKHGPDYREQIEVVQEGSA